MIDARLAVATVIACGASPTDTAGSHEVESVEIACRLPPETVWPGRGAALGYELRGPEACGFALARYLVDRDEAIVSIVPIEHHVPASASAGVVIRPGTQALLVFQTKHAARAASPAGRDLHVVQTDCRASDDEADTCPETVRNSIARGASMWIAINELDGLHGKGSVILIELYPQAPKHRPTWRPHGPTQPSNAFPPALVEQHPADVTPQLLLERGPDDFVDPRRGLVVAMAPPWLECGSDLDERIELLRGEWRKLLTNGDLECRPWSGTHATICEGRATSAASAWRYVFRRDAAGHSRLVAVTFGDDSSVGSGLAFLAKTPPCAFRE